MKKVIWFIGSNSSGKTSQCKLIHRWLGTAEKVIKTVPFVGLKSNITTYTTFGRVAHVGAVKDNQCTGTDTLSKKEQIEAAYLLTLMENDVDVILIDGIMATATWADFIEEARKWFDIETYVILLNFDTAEDNLLRVMSRRAKKQGVDVSVIKLDDKTILNVSGKQRGFQSMFSKVRHKLDYGIIIDATLKQHIIHETIIKKTNLL